MTYSSALSRRLPWARVLVWIVLSLSLCTLRSFGQDVDEINHTEIEEPGACGFSMERVIQMSTSLEYPYVLEQPEDPQPLVPIMTCGWFRLHFDDETFLTGIGFDGTTAIGLARQNTACAVFTYISSVLAAPPNSAIIDIRFPITTTLGGPLATAGPFFDPNVIALGGVSSGYAYDHILSGVDPNVNQVDGLISVDFITHNINANPNFLFTGCDQYDLYTILLHEATHVLGWFSAVEPDGGGIPSSSWFNNSFGNVFTHYDSLYLWWGDMHANGPFQKLVTITNPNPIQFNVLNQPGCMIDGRVWLRNAGHGTHNHAIASSFGPEAGPYGTGAFMQWVPGTSLSHFESHEQVFGIRSHLSPGQRYNHVMGGTIHRRGEKRQTYTLPEVRILAELGYPLDPNFLANNPINNTPPFTTNITGAVSHNGGDPFDWPDQNAPHFITTSCQPVVIDLNAQPDLGDLEGDPLSVFPGSVFNIRGCGTNGNDHGQVTLNGPMDQITFTPRPEFGGRAQFGFHLWDGQERGDFVYYTIFVQPDACFACPANNMVMEQDYEQGEEVTQTGSAASEAIPNSSHADGANGLFYSGRFLTDCHPFTEHSWQWTAGGSDYIRFSHKACPNGTLRTTGFGYAMSLVNNVVGPWLSPNSFTGDRYHRFAGPRNYFQLCEPVHNCRRYRLVMRTNYDVFTALAAGTPIPLNMVFSDDWTNPNTDWYNTNIQGANNAQIISRAQGTGWQPDTVEFWYCGGDANIMNLQVPHYGAVGGGLFIDDVELYEIPPGQLTVDAGLDTLVHECAHDSVPLFATPNEVRCGLQYVWSPAVGLDNANIQNPLAYPAVPTTYTVQVTDPCTGMTATDQVFVNVIDSVCFTITKTAQPTMTYSGAPVQFTIVICNNTPFPETVCVEDFIDPGLFVLAWLHGTNPFPVSTPITVNPGCDTIRISGYYYVMGTHTNTVTLDPDCNGPDPAISDDVQVTVLQSCPLAVSGYGDCVNGPVHMCLSVHSLIADIETMDFLWIYPDFLAPPANLMASITGPAPFDPSSFITAQGPYVPMPGYNYATVHLVFNPPLVNTMGIYQLACVAFDLVATPPPMQNQFVTLVEGSHGMHLTDLYDSGGNEIHPNAGFYTQSAHVLLSGCPNMLTLDAGFTVYVPPCGGAVTVHGNFNDPGTIHFWTWGDDRTTPINGSQDYTYDYFAPITMNTGGWPVIPPIPPAPPGTYTITHTVILNGVASTQTQTITIHDCCAASLTIPDGTYSSSLPSTISGTVDIEGLLIVDQDLTFVNADVIMEPGAEIIVQPSVALQIDQSSVHACNGIMWKSITVENGGTVYVSSSTIDDGENAITGLDGATIWVKNTQFHGNRVGISIPWGVPWNNVALAVNASTFYSAGAMAQPYPGQTTVVGQVGYAAMEFWNTSVTITGYGNSIFNMSNGIVAKRTNLGLMNMMMANIAPDPAYAHYANGAGVYARGGHGSFGLKQIGFGTSGAGVSFYDCRWGIYTEYMSVTSEQNEMVQVGTAYHVERSGHMTARIQNNNVNTLYDGIQLFFNDGALQLQVDNNEITFADNSATGNFTRGYMAINVREANGANPSSVITNNTIHYAAGSTTARIGIGMVSARSYRVSANRLFMVDNASNRQGIITSGCQKPMISCNSVLSSDPSIGSDPGQCGIRNNLGNGPAIQCNTVDGTTNGVHFSGPAYGTDLSGNNIYNHVYGLHLDATAIIGAQFFKGNLWYAAAAGLGAWYENPVNAAFYPFIYDPTMVGAGNPEPPSWDPWYWFWAAGGHNNTCAYQEEDDGYQDCYGLVVEDCPDCPVDDIDKVIAEGGLENEPVTEQTRWMMRGDLYDKLTEHPELMEADEQLHNFYNELQNTAIGQFRNVDGERRRLFFLDPSIIDQLAASEAELDALQMQINEAMEQLTQEGITFEEGQPLLAMIAEVNHVIGDITMANSEMLSALDEERYAISDYVRELNGSVSAEPQIEVNEQTVNDIYLTTVAHDADGFSEDDAARLFEVANQCPITGGNAVYRARALYALIDDAYEFEDAELCAEQGVEMRALVSVNTSAVQVLPNPASNEATLLYNLPEGERGTLVLHDALGKEVMRHSLSADVQRFFFSTAMLVPGAYHFTVLGNNSMLGEGKLMIVR